MSRLLLNFADRELNDFRWAVEDPASQASPLEWQYANASELAAVTAAHRIPVVILIPQQCVLMTSVDLPQKPSRQIIAAIGYQVEDRLAQDVDSQHFALGDTSVNPVQVVVVEKAIMKRCLELCDEHDLRLAQIIPELFLCPWSESTIRIIDGYQGLLLRYDQFLGFSCARETLPDMLKLIKQQGEINEIIYYAASEQDTEGSPVEIFDPDIITRPMPAFTLLDTAVIDLQQREFQPSSAWKEIARPWKWIAIIAGVLTLSFAYNKAIALQQLESDLNDIEAKQYQLVKPYLPVSTGPDADLKKILINQLKQQQSSQVEIGFLSMLVKFSDARVAFKSVEVSRISYQKEQLNIDLQSSQLSDIEALQVAVEKQGIKARLQDLNIRPDLISGRLVLSGDVDV